MNGAHRLSLLIVALGFNLRASMAAWLPEHYRELGWSARDSGGLIGAMTVFQVLAALGVPALARGSRDRRPWLRTITGSFQAAWLLLAATVGVDAAGDGAIRASRL